MCRAHKSRKGRVALTLLYLAYIEWFDVVPQVHLPRGQRLAPDLVWGMYVLHWAYRNDDLPMGAVMPLYHLH